MSTSTTAPVRVRHIIVDLDGTLLRSDCLVESIVKLLKATPLALFELIAHLFRDKAHLKEWVCRRVTLDVASLPYDAAILAWAKAQRDAGARLVLATATHSTLAGAVSRHLGIFDAVHATERHRNLKADAKRDVLVARYGLHGFEYVGNERADLPVWRSALTAHVANPNARLLRAVRSATTLGQVFHTRRRTATTWLKALRPHQWAKNLLLFVPLAAAHEITNVALLLPALIAFVSFGLAASSVYLLNDLVDVEDDRHHPAKRHRPLASGDLAPVTAIAWIPVLAGAAFLLAWAALPAGFVAALGIYFVTTLAYSLWLKRIVLIDVLTLAMLYTLRVFAGAAAFALDVTFWMLAFSIFIFMSLAFLKRYTELRSLRARGAPQKTRGRGYYPSDIDLLANLGSAAGYLSVLVLALYIQESTDGISYSRPELLWLSCPLLLFWISRAWLLAHRGAMHDDPVVFALRDGVSRGIGVLFVLAFVAAI